MREPPPTAPPAPSRLRAALPGVLAAAFLLLLVAIIVAADRAALPGFVRRLYSWPGGDKAGHVVLLAGMSFLLNLALRDRRVRVGRAAPRLGSLLVALAITAEEASQAVFPNRTLSGADLACSYLGTWLGGLAAPALLARRTTPVRNQTR